LRGTDGYRYTVELGYNIIRGTDYLVSLWMSVVITKENNVMVNSDELIGNTEYLTL
jgi:hypothetical protein